jgi:hypothetical protein
VKPQALLADQIERISDSMASFIESTHPDVLGWRPEIPGSAGTRTVLEMVGECVAVNRRFAAKLAQESEEGITQPVLASAEDAISQIVESGQRFAKVIANLSDEALEADYIHAGNQMSGTYLIIGAYRNMAYHCGQINLIQRRRRKSSARQLVRPSPLESLGAIAWRHRLAIFRMTRPKCGLIVYQAPPR